MKIKLLALSHQPLARDTEETAQLPANQRQSAQALANLGCLGMQLPETYANLGRYGRGEGEIGGIARNRLDHGCDPLPIGIGIG